MQKKRKSMQKLVASLIVFMMIITNFAPFGSALVSLAVDENVEKINFSAKFVELEDTQEKMQDSGTEQNTEEIEQPENLDDQQEEGKTGILEDAENSENNENGASENEAPEDSAKNDNETAENEMPEDSENNDNETAENEILEDSENNNNEVAENEMPKDSESNEKLEDNGNNEEDRENGEEKTDNNTNVEEPIDSELKNSQEEKVTGLAIEIKIAVQDKGYFKNAKLEIKNLANQIIKLKEDVAFDENIQLIEENKIKLNQINGGSEVKIYIPVELKKESLVDVNMIQAGVEMSLSGTYVDEKGNEEIITKQANPVVNISNNVNLVIDSSIEKYIPYVKDGINQALVQLKINTKSENQTELPIKDSRYEVELPQIEGVTIENVSVLATSTAYTNGLISGDVLFTPENWSYENGKVIIGIDNQNKDGKYQMTTGADEFIISYTYVNCKENMLEETIKSKVTVSSNVFTSTETTQTNATIEKEYNLSQANSNIITYEVTAKSEGFSKGYLYANQNAETPEYELEFENTLDVNISRADLVETIEIRESAEYFQDDEGNTYNTSTENGNNSYYKSVKINKEKLIEIIGETGNFELLLEDGTSLIQVNSSTEDDGDGNITISFGENKIDKILIRINNPIGEGILNIGTVKAVAKTTYGKEELMKFTSFNNEYVAASALQEGIITEMGSKKVSVGLNHTITNATVSLNRNELSTLVKNENIEINISLNNANDISDMYSNPVFELLLPEEVTEVSIKDINLLYGNDELEIENVETIRNSENQIVLRVTLKGSQTKYTLGDSEKGTTIILNTDMTVDMYRASRDSKLEMNYYNNDATNYGIGSEWEMMNMPSADMLIGRQGKTDVSLKIVAPEGFVNAQMISDYKEGASIISVNQGKKEDTIDTFTNSRIAEMKMLLINNTNKDLTDVHILGRTIFSGNKSITENKDLGTNMTAPMVSEIMPLDNLSKNATIYYSENEEATDDLENEENAWQSEVYDFTRVKSFMIILNQTVEVGNILAYSYNFEIPENLNNNLSLSGTFGTYYANEFSEGIGEADQIVLSTGKAPILKVETTSDVDEDSVTEGQRIKYTVKVTNEGRAVSEGVIVNSAIPEGTTYVENGQLQASVTELKIDMGDINPKETKEATYEVEVNKTVVSQTGIQSNNIVEAKGLEKPIYTVTEPVEVELAQVSITLDSDKNGKIVEENDTIEYTTVVSNKSGGILKNSKIVQYIPVGLEFEEAYIEAFNDDGITTYREGEGIYDANTRTVTWNIDSISVFKAFKLKVKTAEIEELEKTIETYSKITADNLEREYSSSKVTKTIVRPQILVDYYSANENKYIKEGDRIQYILELDNTGMVDAKQVNISNIFPDSLRVISVETIQNGTVYSGLSGKNANVTIDLPKGERTKVVMSCVAENLSSAEEEQFIENSCNISGKNLISANTEPVETIIQSKATVIDNAEANTNSNNNSQVYVNEANKTKIENSNVKIQTYRIFGKAFEDMNRNGQRDSDEEGMGNIVAKLCDASSQEVIAQTVTNSIGEYLFENVIPGEYYIKFEYDSTKYKLTDYKKEGVNSGLNSDAIISNYKAVTDKIKITDTSISDIDIGLIRAGIFDLSLDANINRVTVQDNKETRTYEMENSKLAKVDIDPKEANASKVFIEYTISVTNNGEIPGYAKSIVDYLPESLTLDTEMNHNWYIASDGNAYNQELEDTLILPGETRNIQLVLIKQMTEDGAGIINNTFEIAKTYNEYAITDIDSTEKNRAQGEDDMSNCDIIIGIKTGGSLINMMIISTTLITMLITLYVIKVCIDKKSKGVIV